MNFIELFSTIGAVIIVGFIINLITQKKKSEQELFKLKKEIDLLNKKIDTLNEQAASVVKKMNSQIEAFKQEADKVTMIVRGITAECNDIFYSFDNIIEKIEIISNTYENPNINFDEKKLLSQKYIKLLKADIEDNTREITRLQRNLGGNGRER